MDPRIVRLSIMIAVTVILVVLVVLLTFISIPPSIPTNRVIKNPKDFCPKQSASIESDGLGGIIDSTSAYIGLSAGNYTFATPRTDLDYDAKCLASQALRNQNINVAENEWKNILQKPNEINDAEMLIYQENQRILDSDLPYFSVIVGVTVAGENIRNNTLDILQGSFVAQKRYNQDHKNASQVRLIIANFGNTIGSAQSVAQQIVTAMQRDTKDHIKAVVDLPEIADTPAVINQLQSGDFPLVLSSSSTNIRGQINSSNTTIFHVEATAEEQGQAAANYITQDCPNLLDDSQPYDCTGPNIVLFMDTQNSYSNALGNAFKTNLPKYSKASNSNKSFQTIILYNSGDPSSIMKGVDLFSKSPPGQPPSYPPDLIYFAGNATDANTLLQDLPQDKSYANVRVLGGDKLYLTGQGYETQYYKHLSFTTFAYPDEWQILKHHSPQFFCDYAQDFAGGMVDPSGCNQWQNTNTGRSGYGYSRPEGDVVLAYDALKVLVAGCDAAINATLSLNSLSSDQLVQSIRSFNTNNPFPGVSGQIAFGSDGNPSNKAILVLRVNERGEVRQEQQYGNF